MRSPPDTAGPKRAASPADVHVEAVRSLARAARLLERASGDLGLPHYRVLCAIASGEDRASRVAERFELGRPTISVAVDALCREGLIERVDVADDQRAVELRLTQQGRKTLDAVEAEMVRVFDDLCRRFPELAAAPRTLAALGQALDARTEERHALRRAERAARGAAGSS